MGKAGQMQSTELDELNQGVSAIDTTLDEIQSLKIINEALEQEKRNTDKPSNGIDEALIEDRMMDKIKKSGFFRISHFDKTAKIQIAEIQILPNSKIINFRASDYVKMAKSPNLEFQILIESQRSALQEIQMLTTSRNPKTEHFRFRQHW